MNGSPRPLVLLALLALVPLGAAAWPGAARGAQAPATFDAPVGQHGGAIRAALADGDRLWIGHGMRVAEVDIADRAAPRLVGHGALLDGVVTGIARAQGRLVVVTATSLYVLDGADPLGPPLGRVATDLPAVRVVARGSHAYALHRRLGTLPGVGEGVLQTVVSVADLGDPAAPRFLAPLALPAEGDVQDIVRAGELLAVAHVDDANARDEAQQRGLVVYDLADPAVPRQVARIAGPAWGRLATPDPEGTRVVGVGIGALALDLADPGRPATVARFDEARVWGRLRDVAVAATADGRPQVAYNGGFAFGVVAGGIEGPGGPEWATIATTAGVPSGGFAAAGGHLYVAERGGRLSAVFAPAAEAGRAQGTLDLVGMTTAVAVDPARPDVALVAADQGGLGALAATGADLAPLGYAFDGRYHGWLDVAGALAVVGDGGSGDVVELAAGLFDVARPDAPRRAGGFDGLRLVYEVELDGRSPIAHVRTWGDEVWHVGTWDLADPAAPRRLGGVDVPGAVTDMARDGDRLVVAGYAPPDAAGEPSEPVLTVVDAADPARPRIARTIRFGAPEGDAYDLPLVAVDGRHAFVATVAGIGASARHRLHAVDLEAGAARGSLAVPGPIGGIAAVGGFALLAPYCPGPADGCAVTAVDARDPARLRDAARIGRELAGGRTAVAATGGTVLVASGERGVQAFRPELPWALPTPPPTLTSVPTAPPVPTATRTITPTPIPTRTRPVASATPTRRPSPTPPPGAVGWAFLPWAGGAAE